MIAVKTRMNRQGFTSNVWVPIISYSFTLQPDLGFFSLLEPKWSFCGVSMIRPLPHGKFQTDLVVRSGRRGVNVCARTESL